MLPSLMLLKVQCQHMHKDATSANLAVMVHLGNMEYCNSVAKQCLDLCSFLCLTACLLSCQLFDHQLACEEDHVAPHLTLGLTCNIACIMHKIHCGMYSCCNAVKLLETCCDDAERNWVWCNNSHYAHQQLLGSMSMCHWFSCLHFKWMAVLRIGYSLDTSWV